MLGHPGEQVLLGHWKGWPGTLTKAQNLESLSCKVRLEDIGANMYGRLMAEL